MGGVASAWSALAQSGLFVTFLTCHFQFAPIFTMSVGEDFVNKFKVSGALCSSSLGWPVVYYLHGMVTIVFFVLHFAFYNDQPHRHGHVSDKVGPFFLP